jgi:hypothetical protein
MVVVAGRVTDEWNESENNKDQKWERESEIAKGPKKKKEE